MNDSTVLEKFTNIKTWTRGDERAPNKPLLILLALGQLQSGNEKLHFKTLESKLTELLKEFGPARKVYHPEYPFWRLQNDGIWQLINAENVTARKGNTDAKKSELIRYDVIGNFTPEILEKLKKTPTLISEIAQIILNLNFPETWHEEILDAVDLDIYKVINLNYKNKRDPDFRNKILNAYEHKCAVCGLSLQMQGLYPVLEAAHIKWHQVLGPDVENNGIALCSIHHKLFDRGAYTLDENNTILVSEYIYGEGLGDWLLRYHGSQLSYPIRTDYYPLVEFKNWHKKEVFRGKPRENN